MRGKLERLYDGAHWLACAALCLITALVVIQVSARVLDTLLKWAGIPPTGFSIPSLTEFAGFLMIAATFLALASTLKRGAHIRVTVALSVVPAGARRALNIAATGGGAALFGFVTWHVLLLAIDSLRFGSVSYGIVPVPLWIPQAVMFLGLAVFTVALIDEAWQTIRTGAPAFENRQVSVLDDHD